MVKRFRLATTEDANVAIHQQKNNNQHYSKGDNKRAIRSGHIFQKGRCCQVS
jgi:hypothetical protein